MSAALPTTRRPRTLTLTLLACLLANPAAAIETRPPTDQERASLAAFQPRAARPVFLITRENAATPWSVSAHVDGPPRRGQRKLCRVERSGYTLDKEWRAAVQPTQLAWLASTCAAAPAQAATLALRMPDTDVQALLESAAPVLTRARLLMAGNTACARHRAAPFILSALDVAPFIPGSEDMAVLVLRGERTTARVWVRRTDLAYDPWNVSCTTQVPDQKKPSSFRLEGVDDRQLELANQA